MTKRRGKRKGQMSRSLLITGRYPGMVAFTAPFAAFTRGSFTSHHTVNSRINTPHTSHLTFTNTTHTHTPLIDHNGSPETNRGSLPSRAVCNRLRILHARRKTPNLQRRRRSRTQGQRNHLHPHPDTETILPPPLLRTRGRSQNVIRIPR